MAQSSERIEDPMPVYAFEDIVPDLPASGAFYIAPGAQVIGNVRLEEDASIWFNAVLRGDNDRIHIGARTNIQDNSVLHTDPGMALTIGADCTIGHNVVLHGCTIGEGSLIGMGSIILNGAKLGKNCLVGANSLITEGKEFPDGAMILGAPARMLRALDERQMMAGRMSAASYVARAKHFRAGLRLVAE